jgi:hypothetical protein
MIIDLSLMRNVRVDAKARIARVAGGSLLGDMDSETMAQGLVTTAGTVSHTGVGGLTLGGGFGRVARRFGLALDNVRSVDMVTASGDIVHASADENPELFWGTRGGGGNFGVVTSFEFDLHPMQRQVVGGSSCSISEAAVLFYSGTRRRSGLPKRRNRRPEARGRRICRAIATDEQGRRGLKKSAARSSPCGCRADRLRRATTLGRHRGPARDRLLHEPAT